MRILVGMSGGVDSSAAAKLLLDDGHTVEGAVLRMHEYTDIDGARRAAELVGIPLHVIDCTELFRERVQAYFCDEYIHGRTPNPCIVCNPEVKFRVLCDYAREHGFDGIATGHYARLVTVTAEGDNKNKDSNENNKEDESKDKNGSARYAFARAADVGKDQTYMLYRLPQDVLEMLMLPMAEQHKTDVREKMSAVDASLGGKKDSQEICFIPDNDYITFIEEKYGASLPGDFVDEDGSILGTHRGIAHYTVGQRKGLGISLGYRAFVKFIDPQSNRVVLGAEKSATDTLRITDVVYSGALPLANGEQRRYTVKLRYQAPAVPCMVSRDESGELYIHLDAPAAAVTPGQSAVLYDGDMIALGGFIV